jgi:hypothetical protein
MTIRVVDLVFPFFNEPEPESLERSGKGDSGWPPISG